jgi:hypothetical protein
MNDNHAPKKNNNNRRFNNNHKKNAPRHNNDRNFNSGRPLNSVQIGQRYDQLLDQHLVDRKRFFEYFNRSSYEECYRLETQFYKSIENLRAFEDSLEDWQFEYLRKKVDRYKPDLTYSTNHDLPTIAEVEVKDDEIEDPHFTRNQMKAFELYAQDTEESSGTIDDYLKYKSTK